MKTRKWCLMVIGCVLAAALILGVPGGAGTAAHAESAQGSRLIGLLITTKELAPSVGDDGVLWAAVHEGASMADTEYTFDAVEGLRFICFIGQDEQGESGIVSNVDDGLSRADFNFENESAVTMDGTILFVPGQDATSFFYNPVLRTEDGRVFAIPGDLMVVDAFMNPPGAAVGQTIRDERKHMEEGAEVTDVTVVSLEIKTVREPLNITLLQFSEAHELLKAEAYAPDAVPEEIVPLAEADYLLLETQEKTAEGAVLKRREAFGREDDFLNTLICREDGICIQQYHEIIWAEAE